MKLAISGGRVMESFSADWIARPPHWLELE
jgi:hypothetical protein